ncbi:UNKNOWN [Stylonychia lemnae]|uniref:Uncharacterized protein n=1 Tax=Stylonychia lemnae TaxID=5949 RepID=A0A078B783_STYLE|nr:UNKNOWN [Stylonychia lemnae]|eukprot:CDW90269.1 UNKNOWN [Stylonychia lemnae]
MGDTQENSSPFENPIKYESSVLVRGDKFYVQCLSRVLLGLFFPLDLLVRILSLDFSQQRINNMHFHVINMILLIGQAFILLLNNDEFYEVKIQQIGIYLTSSQTVVILLALIYIIFTLIMVKDDLFQSNSFSYQEFQGNQNLKESQQINVLSGGSAIGRKRSQSQEQKQNQKQARANNQQQDSEMNFDNQSLQLFDSASQAEETDRNTEGFDSKQGTQKKNSLIEGRQKKMNLNLEDIENISDLDLESVKNSDRAITFNQFELTKNIMMNGIGINEDSKVDLNQTNGELDNSNKQDKINSSQIELITSITDNQMNSASSSDRRIRNLNMTLDNPRNNSLGQITDKTNRRSLFERTRQNSVQLNSMEVKKLTANPYAKLDEDQPNQTTQGPQEHNLSPSKQDLNKGQSQENSQNQISLQNEGVRSVKNILGQEFVKRWISITILVAMIHQSIDDKLQIQLQRPNIYGLNLKEASHSLSKYCLIPIMLYLPTTVLILRKLEKIKYIRLMIALISLTVVSEIIMIQYNTNKNSDVALTLVLSGLEKTFAYSALVVLFVLGLRLVKIEQRYFQVSIFYLCQNFGFLLGSLMGQTLQISIAKSMFPQNVLGIIQVILTVIALLFTIFMGGSNENVYRSSSSSDVLSGPQRLEQIQKQLENQEKTILDPAVNLQYVDSKKKKNKKQNQKQKKSKLQEIHVTNPQQPSEVIDKLEEEDDIDRSSTVNQSQQQQLQQQFQRRVL